MPNLGCGLPRTRLCRRLLLAPFLLYLFEEGVEDLVAVDLAQRLTLGEDHAIVLTARHAIVGVARLAGAVDDAPHDRDGEMVLEVPELIFYFRGHHDQVETKRAGAARAGDYFGTSVPKIQGGEDLVRHRHLLHRVLRERDADGVSDAVR